MGGSDSLFVNAACWGLVVSGKLARAESNPRGLDGALTAILGRVGEPVIRAATRAAMGYLGSQFVLGETIGDALARARRKEERGYRYSFDMLGEASMTMADADRYLEIYREAIDAVGRSSAGRGIYAGPGVSVKLSALHPRYSRAQHERAMTELLPRLKQLMVLARKHDIGLTIDAEEADRLEISLDLLEALALDPDLAGWDGLGFVIQSVQKRGPFVVDWVLDLARRSGRRLMVRLVKGAYWDSEVKRAQVAGYADYPVFTRKSHTDVAYLACAAKLLAEPALVYPQFATHNASTLCEVIELAGAHRDFEFQCLHGMGETLYDQVVGAADMGLPCRIYAPVGTHETLLAYLVRRLLENGANSSFVNQIVDPDVPLERLLEDPVTTAKPFAGSPHPRVPAPPSLYPDRRNSRGIDLTDEHALAALEASLDAAARESWTSLPDARRRIRRCRSRREQSRPQPGRSGHRRRGGERRHARGRRPRPRVRARLRRLADHRSPRNAPGSSSGAPTSSRRTRRASFTSPCARPARPCPTPSARSARPSTSAATTRCAFARSRSPRPWAWSPASARGTSRSRSSWARSRRRSPRATPSWRSPPSRRPSSPPRRSGCSARPACPRPRSSCCPGRARPSARASWPTPASTASCSPARPKWPRSSTAPWPRAATSRSSRRPAGRTP